MPANVGQADPGQTDPGQTNPGQAKPDEDPTGATAVMGAATPRQTGRWLSTTPADWVAEVWVDPAWYQGQQTTHRIPVEGPPEVVGLHSRSLLIGRRSSSRGTHPDLDCSADPGVSRRHAQLTFDGRRWYIEDLDSSNGTFVATDGLPEVPIERRVKVELGESDNIYLGAWTRITIRAADERERGS